MPEVLSEVFAGFKEGVAAAFYSFASKRGMRDGDFHEGSASRSTELARQGADTYLSISLLLADGAPIQPFQVEQPLPGHGFTQEDLGFTGEWFHALHYTTDAKSGNR